MDPQKDKDKLDIVENKLRELRAQIEKMEKQNAALYEELGLGPHQVQEILNDPSNFEPEVYEFIQKERQTLEMILDRRIDEARANVKRDIPPDSIRGHWIFVR